jgi:uncharacterized protein YecA (UPF0149 family)
MGVLEALKKVVVGTPPTPIPKLGRNQECWCGSGKKYKQCHMRKDEQARRARAAAV